MQLPDRVYSHNALRGYAGTQETLRLLADEVARGHLNPQIRARMRQLLADLPRVEWRDIVERVWDHVTAEVRYLPDPIGAEHVTAPDELDREIDDGTAFEDCESLALYAATLLASVGVPSRFVVMGRDPKNPQRFSHCYLEALNPRTGEVLPFDPVGVHELGPRFQLGDSLLHPSDPVERWGLDGKQVPMQRTQQLGDIWDDIRQGADAIKTIAPVFGPYGVAVAGVIGVGEKIVDVATGKQVGTALPVLPPPPALPPKPLPVARPIIAPHAPASMLTRLATPAQQKAAAAAAANGGGAGGALAAGGLAALALKFLL